MQIQTNPSPSMSIAIPTTVIGIAALQGFKLPLHGNNLHLPLSDSDICAVDRFCAAALQLPNGSTPEERAAIIRCQHRMASTNQDGNLPQEQFNLDMAVSESLASLTASVAALSDKLNALTDKVDAIAADVSELKTAQIWNQETMSDHNYNRLAERYCEDLRIVRYRGSLPRLTVQESDNLNWIYGYAQLEHAKIIELIAFYGLNSLAPQGQDEISERRRLALLMDYVVGK